MTLKQVMAAFEDCENTRNARNTIIPHYKPHEVVEMTPENWLLASRIYCDAKAGYCEQISIKSAARQWKVSTKRLGRIFPESWYDANEDRINLPMEYQKLSI